MISPRQRSVLNAIDGWATPREIQEATGFTRGQVWTIISTMYVKGMLERKEAKRGSNRWLYRAAA